jgi:hypothetical protein
MPTAFASSPRLKFVACVCGLIGLLLVFAAFALWLGVPEFLRTLRSGYGLVVGFGFCLGLVLYNVVLVFHRSRR